MTVEERGLAGALQTRVVVGGWYAPKPASGELNRAAVGLGDFDSGHELAVDEGMARMRLAGLDSHGQRPDIRTALRQQTIAGPGVVLDEVIANAVADAKAVG